MVGGGVEDRIEVEHIRAERLEVVNLGPQPRKVAAPEVDLVAPHPLGVNVVANGGELRPFPQRHPRFVQGPFGVEVVGCNKSVHHDLIDHRAKAPVLSPTRIPPCHSAIVGGGVRTVLTAAFDVARAHAHSQSVAVTAHT